MTQPVSNDLEWKKLAFYRSVKRGMLHNQARHPVVINFSTDADNSENDNNAMLKYSETKQRMAGITHMRKILCLS